MLGQTGLEVGVAGLGCGGHSRLGQSYGRSSDQSVALVRAAIDAGVTLIDTAAAYGTEEIVGEAVRNCRDEVVLSTKLGIVTPGTSPLGTNYIAGEDFVRLAEDSLKRLRTDHIDILHLHGVMPGQPAQSGHDLQVASTVQNPRLGAKRKFAELRIAVFSPKTVRGTMSPSMVV